MKALTILERIKVQDILSLSPIKGNIVGLKEKRLLFEELSFSEQEAKEHEIQFFDDGRIIWNPAYSNSTKPINFPDWIANTVKERLEKLNNDSELTEEYVSLYEKFVEA